MKTARSLTADEAREKAAECLEMAERSQDTRHQIMLRHMAETWERIARDIQFMNRPPQAQTPS